MQGIEVLSAQELGMQHPTTWFDLMKIDKYKTHESSPQKTLLGNVLGTIAGDYLK
jgi:hypothetical protein